MLGSGAEAVACVVCAGRDDGAVLAGDDGAPEDGETAEMAIEPDLRALEVARTAAASNPEFRSLLTPVLDQLGDMTKKARQRQEEARKRAKQKTEPT